VKRNRSLEECLREVEEISHYRGTDYDAIREAIGDEFLRRRLNRQLDLYETHRSGSQKETLRWQRKIMRTLVWCSLSATGQLKRARRNARSPQVVEREVFLPNLPPAFDGYRILHLSDFHFDFIPELPELLRKTLEPLSFDTCFLTGDFRGETTGPYEESLEHLARCRDLFGPDVVTVLGNHDNVELYLRLPQMGIRCLMNEYLTLSRNGQSLLVVGVDDPQHYQTHDLDFCRDVIAASPCSILLSHTPEICMEAAEAGFDYMMAGHTHGGQLCLPGGIPLIGHIGGAPRCCIRGEWSFGKLQGYTSRGIGCSSMDVRLNCPPEVTLHTLRRFDP